MTYKEFYQTYIKPNLEATDKPYNDQLFNDTKDLLHKDNMITDRQIATWSQPNNKFFN